MAEARQLEYDCPPTPTPGEEGKPAQIVPGLCSYCSQEPVHGKQMPCGKLGSYINALANLGKVPGPTRLCSHRHDEARALVAGLFNRHLNYGQFLWFAKRAWIHKKTLVEPRLWSGHRILYHIHPSGPDIHTIDLVSILLTVAHLGCHTKQFRAWQHAPQMANTWA